MYNNLFGMQDFFMNPNLKRVLPQFGRNQPLQNVYTFAEIERRVTEYLRGILGATKTGDGELQVRGKHPEVLARVRNLRTTMEQMFSSIPSIVKNLRANTPLYTPFASIAQVQDMKTPEQKQMVMRVVLDNIQFNPDLQSLNSVTDMGSNFYKMQSQWMREVGYQQRGGGNAQSQNNRGRRSRNY